MKQTRSLSSLSRNAQNILAQRFELRRGQRVLIICDEEKARIGASFTRAALNLGARVKVFSLGQERFSKKNHRDLASLIRPGSYQIFINVIENPSSEIKDRLKLVEIQKKAKGKIIHSPGIEESMLEIDINYAEMMEKAKRLLLAFKNANVVKIETDLGTDLELGITDREFHNDVFPREQGFGNFPCGEIFCAPVEDKVNGIMLADGSASSLGIMPQPLRFEIKGGRITRMQWQNPPSNQNKSLLAQIKKTLFQDEWANVVGEFGIGLAPYPICGNMLQDEKVGGTIHIAFGRNDIFGGQNLSKSHVDFLVRQPTVTVYYSPKRDPRAIIENGRLLI